MWIWQKQSVVRNHVHRRSTRLKHFSCWKLGSNYVRPVSLCMWINGIHMLKYTNTCEHAMMVFIYENDNHNNKVYWWFMLIRKGHMSQLDLVIHELDGQYVQSEKKLWCSVSPPCIIKLDRRHSFQQQHQIMCCNKNKDCTRFESKLRPVAMITHNVMIQHMIRSKNKEVAADKLT